METTNAFKSVDNAWNAVALEERLELVSQVQAQGLLNGILAMLIISTIGYGLDNISFLVAGVLSCIFITPISMSYHWRRTKPALILSYLAVRAVARRYAFGYGFANLDIILVYRGYMKELYQDKEEERKVKSLRVIDLETKNEDEKEVWICLLSGGVVILSEHIGGAKLEFIASVADDLNIRKSTKDEDAYDRGCVVESMDKHNPKKALVFSNLPGAQYVFEKQLEKIIYEYEAPFATAKDTKKIGI
ncbi:MAG: hypothetical protein KBC84_10230 [Proteobacteria bacterium]|nr:hypothetical protein [Pseudomonadota bacterium]